MTEQDEYRSPLDSCLIALPISLALWAIIAAIIVLLERLV